MEFTQSGPDIVRSDHQRWLLRYWASQRGSALLPIWHALDERAIAIPFDNLALTEVVAESDNFRFRIAYHGIHINEAFGSVRCVGRFLDEILPQPYLGPALATYQCAVVRRIPVYTVSDMRDASGRIVHHERLLLPFGLGGARTERVLASIEAVSPEGPFELRELMRAPARPPVIALCAMIQY